MEKGAINKILPSVKTEDLISYNNSLLPPMEKEGVIVPDLKPAKQRLLSKEVPEVITKTARKKKEERPTISDNIEIQRSKTKSKEGMSAVLFKDEKNRYCILVDIYSNNFPTQEYMLKELNTIKGKKDIILWSPLSVKKYSIIIRGTKNKENTIKLLKNYYNFFANYAKFYLCLYPQDYNENN